MRVPFVTMRAEDVPEDTFVYHPKKKMFFFVDGKDYVPSNFKKVILVFEPDGDPETWQYHKFNVDDELMVISDYTINKDEFPKSMVINYYG